MSKIDVINSALKLIGAQPIVALNDTTSSARSIQSVFELSYVAVLSSYPFTFAKRASSYLATPADVTALPGYLAIRVKPTDLVVLHNVLDENNCQVEFTVSADGINIKKDVPVKAVYAVHVPIEETPPLFKEAFVYYLAMRMAYDRNETAALTASLQQMYEQAFIRAVRSDSQQASSLHQLNGWDAYDNAYDVIG